MNATPETSRARFRPDAPTVSEADLRRLTAALAPGGERVGLIIDLDGLFPGEDPGDLPEAVPALMNGLRQALDGAVAVVSARTVAEIDRWLSPVRLPALGEGGRQWRADLGRPTAVREYDGLAAALSAAVSRDERFDGRSLLFVGDAARSGALPPGMPAVQPPAGATSGERAQAILAALAQALAQRLV